MVGWVMLPPTGMSRIFLCCEKEKWTSARRCPMRASDIGPLSLLWTIFTVLQLFLFNVEFRERMHLWFFCPAGPTNFFRNASATGEHVDSSAAVFDNLPISKLWWPAWDILLWLMSAALFINFCVHVRLFSQLGMQCWEESPRALSTTIPSTHLSFPDFKVSSTKFPRQSRTVFLRDGNCLLLEIDDSSELTSQENQRIEGHRHSNLRRRDHWASEVALDWRCLNLVDASNWKEIRGGRTG